MRNGEANRADLPLAAGAAAVGLVAGFALNQGRRFAVRAAEAMTGDWSDALKADHLMIIELFEDLEATCRENGRDRARKARRRLARLKTALEKHAWQEENVIYPAVRLGGAREAAAKLVDDHAEAKALLFELAGGDPAEPGWADGVKRLRTLMEAHIRAEEQEIFPALQAALTPDQTVELTAQMHKAGAQLG